MNDSIGQKPFGPLRSYGRLKSRPIKPRQAGLMDSLLPGLALDLSAPLDRETLKPDAAEVWLEIGFGGGEHMAAQAAMHPQALILGAEPFVNGAASDVRLHHGDARDLIAALPDACLERVFILFPDPWPKARHHKRRLIQPEVLSALARVLKPGGRLRFATDWADYADWTLERILGSDLFDWPAERAADWRVPPADHVTTRYEEKKLGDCAPVFLDFVRRDTARPG